MPSRTCSILGATAFLLIVGYIGLVVTTVTFAAWQTDLAAEARKAETTIGTLESRYYARVAELGATDPGSVGLTKPHAVHYAALKPTPGLTLR